MTRCPDESMEVLLPLLFKKMTDRSNIEQVNRPTNQPTNRHEGFINNKPKRPIVQMGKGTRYLFIHKGSNLTENLLKEKKK